MIENVADWWDTLAAGAQATAILLGAALIGFLAALIVIAVAKRFPATDSRIIHRLRWPTRLLLPLLAAQAALPAAGFESEVTSAVRHAIWVGFIAALAWLAVVFVNAAARLYLKRFDVAVSDNLRARQVHTQARILTRTLDVLIVILGGAIILMSFDEVRQLGASILASAGLAGIIVGLAARPLVSNILAGLQIALSGSIRLDDVLIIEGEWGRVEEITTTYVVFRIWDQRRLVIPLNYFLEHPFQHWTRVSAELLGTVFLHLDYDAPLDAMRDELKRIVENHDKWDGRVALIQVTDATERTTTVRVLVSGADAGSLWDLRCDVRERLIDWTRAHARRSLPRERRVELEEGEQPERERASSD